MSSLPLNENRSKKNAKVVESDSDPSCDNFEEEELILRFEVAVSEDEMAAVRP